MIFRKIRGRSKGLIIFIAFTFVAAAAFFGISTYISSRSQRGPLTGLSQQDTLISVNGEPIKAMEFLYIIEDYYSYLQLMPSSDVMELQNNIVLSLIQRALLLQEGHKRGIEAVVTDADVEEVIDMYLLENEISLDELVAQLRASGDSLANAKHRVREGLQERELIFAVEDFVKGNVEVTSEDIAKEYEEVAAQVIYISTFQEDEETAFDLAIEARDKLQAGENFETVAINYSDDFYGTDEDSGLVFVKYDSYLEPQIIEAAFSLVKGEISEIITTRDGHYILKAEEITKAAGEEFEAAKPALEKEVLAKKGNAYFQEWMEELIESADVEIFDELLAGYYWYRLADYDKTIKNLTAAVKKNPRNFYLYDILGHAHYYKGNIQKATAVFADAIKEFPAETELRFSFIDFLYSTGDHTRMGKELETIIADNSEDLATMQTVLSYLHLTDSVENIKEVNSIIESLLAQEALQEDPELTEEEK